ncbi:MAG: class I SAM-dependent methyltransferase [Thermoanaerobaculia bacterium]
MSSFTRHADSVQCCDDEWESAYRRFETNGQEIGKFTRRFLAMGAGGWPRDSRIACLFCGRGNGMVALERLGFSRLSGFDLSESLLAEYQGPAKCFVADCREPLPVEAESYDAAIVQGGLHHLPELPGDLELVLREVGRILTPSGRLVLVEPWMTPFLVLVHAACGLSPARWASSKLEALAVMIEHERFTYENWLSRPEEVRDVLHRHFEPLSERVAWGKLSFVGRPRPGYAT